MCHTPDGMGLRKLLHQDRDEDGVERRAVAHHKLDESALLPEREVHVGDELVPRADAGGDEARDAHERLGVVDNLLLGDRLQQMEQVDLSNRFVFTTQRQMHEHEHTYRLLTQKSTRQTKIDKTKQRK